MAKKKKNKLMKFMSDIDSNSSGKKGKKNKKKGSGEDREYRGRKLKCVKPTLDRKEVRQAHKSVQEPVKLPEGVLEARKKCNHCQDTMTVVQFKERYPDSMYVLPMLDTYIKVFGEDNIRICNGCFEILVDEALLTTDRLQQAFMLVIAVMNNLMAKVRMNKKELKEMKKSLKDVTEIYGTVIPMLKELRDKQSDAQKKRAASSAYGAATPAGAEADSARHETSDGRTPLEIPDGIIL